MSPLSTLHFSSGIFSDPCQNLLLQVNCTHQAQCLQSWIPTTASRARQLQMQTVCEHNAIAQTAAQSSSIIYATSAGSRHDMPGHAECAARIPAILTALDLAELTSAHRPSQVCCLPAGLPAQLHGHCYEQARVHSPACLTYGVLFLSQFAATHFRHVRSKERHQRCDIGCWIVCCSTHTPNYSKKTV